MPLECPWTVSSGTQTAVAPQFKLIAAEVPLDCLQRHSSGSRPHNSSILPPKCPWTVSSGTQTAQDKQLPVCLDAAKSGFAGQSHLAGVTDSFIKTEANYMELLWDMLPDTLSSRQKNGRINTILTYMRRKNIIKTDSDNHQ